MRRAAWIVIGLTASWIAEVPAWCQQQVIEIFQESCVACHNEKQQAGKLRLDSLGSLSKGGAGGAVVVPGKSTVSPLIQRVVSLDRNVRMPMGMAPLPAAKIEVLRKWVDEGAPGLPVSAAVLTNAAPAVKPQSPSKHWAYVKPVKPAVPSIKNAASVRNPIDAFVLAKLEQQGLTFSPEAPKEILIRRASLDLTGLPPTPKEIDEFLQDTRPDAYERLVDRLLASPHYGERWARPWLDLARYADTNGFEADRRRTMYPYRDWVITALNRNMPFDQFTIEQIAGDMLPGSSKDQQIATGFHRNTMFNEEGGVDKDEAHFEVLLDRVNTTAAVWLGTSLGCTQCHNHKYDPFTQREYYSMMAFFSPVRKEVEGPSSGTQRYKEPQLDLATSDQEIRRAELVSKIAALDKKLKSVTPELEAAQSAWEKRVLSASADWRILLSTLARAQHGTTLTPQQDGTVLASGANPQRETYVVEGELAAGRLTGLRLEALPDKSLPRGGPGRDIYGNFLISSVHVELSRNGKWEAVEFKRTLMDDGRPDDRKGRQLWVVDASRDPVRFGRQMVLVLKDPITLDQPARVRFTIDQNSDLIGQSLGRFRVSATSAVDPSWIVKIRANLRPALESKSRSEKDSRALADAYRAVAPSLDSARSEVSELRTELEKLGIVSALVMGESTGYDRPYDFVRTRGGFSAKAEKVFANVPAVLNPLPEDAMPNRLGLARWLVSKDNPLTARVTVNRLWEQYFGRGIVATPEDFGTQGERPTHPELLDWLAVEFMDRNWNVKAIHRLIATSAAYRQTSRVTPVLLQADAYNRLISRGPRFRMEAEMIRDAALAESGLLSLKIGGPSVFPPQPPGVWDVPYSTEQWVESKGEDKYRRGLYTFIRRSALYPSMMNFDAASREFCTVRRIRTNTPLQALTTLNDAAFFEASQALGKRIVAEGGDSDRSRVEYGFRLVTARRPKPTELDRMLSWRAREAEYFAAHPDEAKKIAGGIDQASWTMFANVLLNLDEALTKE